MPEPLWESCHKRQQQLLFLKGAVALKLLAEAVLRSGGKCWAIVSVAWLSKCETAPRGDVRLEEDITALVLS